MKRGEDYCPNCNSENIRGTTIWELGNQFHKYRCPDCEETWTIPA